eukprot:6475165-Alexandrium_andersonii.AAC.1
MCIRDSVPESARGAAEQEAERIREAEAPAPGALQQDSKGLQVPAETRREEPPAAAAASAVAEPQGAAPPSPAPG